MRISDWSSDVCSSVLQALFFELIGDARDIAIGDHHVARELAHFHAARRAQQLRHHVEARQSGSVFGAQTAAYFGFDPVAAGQLGRASCREGVCQYVYISVVAVSLNKNNYTQQIENG